MEQFVVEVLSAVGVPAGISFYVLIRVNATLERLTEAITKIDAKLSSLPHHY